MQATKFILALALTALVSACADTNVTTRDMSPSLDRSSPHVDIASNKGAGLAGERMDLDPEVLQFLPEGVKAEDITDARLHETSLRVTDITVSVPKTLKVSEENQLLPHAEIVWRGDPVGDRHAQVKSIFETGLTRGTADMKGTTPVSIDVQVLRFHSLTERARRRIGGVHSIQFALVVQNARTGDTFGPPRIVDADLLAFGGQKADEADARGETQKVRITAHLAQVIRNELTQPEGHENARLGFIQVLNQF